MQKYMIFLSWPSCAWKSTVSDALFSKYPWLFRVKSDSIKRFIAWYSRQVHIPAVTNMSFDLSESAMKEWFSLLLETRFSLERYQELANRYWYKVIVINLEAPYDILEKRFFERVSSHKESWSNFPINTDVERFKSLYESYMTDKIPATITFDTSAITVEEIVKTIDNIITS